MQELEGGKSNEYNLINNGTFGCIYNPSITCKGEVGSVKYITKIQKSKRSIVHELRISEKIRNMSGYVRYFAPVLKYCNVHFSRDHIQDLRKCEVFKKEPTEQIEKTSYVSMKTRFVGKHDLRDHLFSNLSYSTFFPKILRTHTHILKALKKLVKHGIVHYDLKYNNIMYDDEKKVPILIDFGQSWIIDELNTEDEINSAFFTFDQYDYWCIDILICSYIFQKVGFSRSKTELVTEYEIERIYEVFVYGKTPKLSTTGQKQIVNDAYLYNILHNPQKMTNFKESFFEYISKFINKRTWWELYESLIKRADTWDSYSVAIIYLNMLDDVYVSDKPFYDKIMNHSNIQMTKYVELLEQIVYNTPDKRPAVGDVLSEFNELS